MQPGGRGQPRGGMRPVSGWDLSPGLWMGGYLVRKDGINVQSLLAVRLLAGKQAD